MVPTGRLAGQVEEGRRVMEFRQLRYFVGIVETESFTRAAEVLFIAQPALSIQMRQLEEELGVQLLERHSRGVRPTDAGQIFLESARKIIAEIDGIKARAADSEIDLTDPVRLAVNPSVAPDIIARILTDAAEQFPDIPITLSEGTSDRICEWLQAGTAHLGLIYFTPGDSRGLQLDPLTREGFVLICRKDTEGPKTIAFADAMTHPLILQPKPHRLRMEVEAVAEAMSLPIDIALEISSVTMVLDLVERGFGSAILPASAARRAVLGGRLAARNIVEPDLGFDLSLAYRVGSHRAPSEILVARLVRQAAMAQ